MLNPSRVLVKEVNWLGDIVMSLPALRAVRRAFPQARLSVLVKKELASFFEGAAWIDELIPYDFRNGFFNRLADRREIIARFKTAPLRSGRLLPQQFRVGLVAAAGAHSQPGRLLARRARPAAQLQDAARG